MKLRILSVLLVSFTTYLSVDAHVARHPDPFPLPSRIVHQFPNPTWVENIAVRSNGKLLLNLLTTPDILQLDPNSPASPILLHRFSSSLALLGIAELYPHVFYIAAGNFSAATSSVGTGTWSVWKVDLSKFCEDKPIASSGLVVSKVTDMPEAGFLNGVTVLSEDTLLLSDSSLGLIWRLNVKTAKYKKIIDVPEMKPLPNSSLPIGINGIKIFKSSLYWANFEYFTFHRAKIDTKGHLIGKVEMLEKGTNVDDFTIDSKGNAWFAENSFNQLGVINVKGGVVRTALGSIDQTTVPGPTSCAFGRGHDDRETLYVVTSGGLAGPINGTITTGGNVIAVDTKGVRS